MEELAVLLEEPLELLDKCPSAIGQNLNVILVTKRGQQQIRTLA